MGMAAMSAGCSSNPFKFFGACGAPMQGFALKPMKEVRVACIGVGSRGAGAVHRIAMIPGTRVVAIADLFQDRIDRRLKWLEDNGKPAPIKAIAGPEGYKSICEMDDVDVVDLKKLPGDFGGAKQDEQAIKTAKQEGLA